MKGFEKSCAHCKEIKSLGQFYKDKSKKDGHTSWCKICVKKNSSKNGPHYSYNDKRKYHLMRNYGITSKQYNQMFEEQNGVCAICNLPEINRKLSVDHNHKTGKVRSLLCQSCNARLGVVEDKNFNKRAKQYLKGHSD